MPKHTPVRALVRFLDDLATTRIRARIVPVVAQCERCGAFHHAAVRFVDDEPMVTRLPSNCGCGEPIDTPEVLRDLIGTARNLIEASAQC